jgi:hypothetical protein
MLMSALASVQLVEDRLARTRRYALCGYYYSAQAISRPADCIQSLQHLLRRSGIGAANGIGLRSAAKFNQI